MHKYAQMTVYFLTTILQKGIISVFPCSLARTTDYGEHSWYLCSHGEFLGVLSSNFTIFQYTQRFPTFEHSRAITKLYLVNLDIDILGVVDKSIYLASCYKPIQGSSGVLWSCTF